MRWLRPQWELLATIIGQMSADSASLALGAPPVSTAMTVAHIECLGLILINHILASPFGLKQRSTSSPSPMVATRMSQLLSATCLLVVRGSRSVGTRSGPEKPSLLHQDRNSGPQTHFGTTMQRQMVDPTHGKAPTQPGHVLAGPFA